MDVNRFFKLVRQWHQCRDALALLLCNEYAIALLSASNLAPCRLTSSATSSIVSGVASTRNYQGSDSVPRIELHADCCQLRTTLDETERCALSIVPPSLDDDDDTLPCPTDQCASCAGTTAQHCVHALLVRAHRQGCPYQGRSNTRAILLLSSLDPAHSLVIAAHCGAVRAYMRTNAGTAPGVLHQATTTTTVHSTADSAEHAAQGRMRWLLPQQLAPRVLHAEATVSYDRLYDGRVAAVLPSRLRYIGGNTSERILRLLFQPKRDRADAMSGRLAGGDGDGGASEAQPVAQPARTSASTGDEFAELESTVLYNVCLLWRLYGYELVDNDDKQSCGAGQGGAQRNPARQLWQRLQWRLRCRYCAASPCVTEEAADFAAVQPRTGGVARGSPHAAQDGSSVASEVGARKGGRVFTVTCATSTDGTAVAHLDCCPWQRLFLRRVTQNAASSSSLRRFVDLHCHIVTTDASSNDDPVDDEEAADTAARDETAGTSATTRASGTSSALGATPQRSPSPSRSSSSFSSSCGEEEPTGVAEYQDTVRLRFILSEVQQLVSCLRASQELEQRGIFTATVAAVLRRIDAIASAPHEDDTNDRGVNATDAVVECATRKAVQMASNEPCQCMLSLPTDACNWPAEAVLRTRDTQIRSEARRSNVAKTASLADTAEIRTALLQDGLTLLRETLTATAAQTSFMLADRYATFARQHRAYLDAASPHETPQELVAQQLCADLLPWAVRHTTTDGVTTGAGASTLPMKRPPAAEDVHVQDGTMLHATQDATSAAHSQSLLILQHIDKAVEYARTHVMNNNNDNNNIDVADITGPTRGQSHITGSSDTPTDGPQEKGTPGRYDSASRREGAIHAATPGEKGTMKPTIGATEKRLGTPAEHPSSPRQARRRHQQHARQTSQAGPVLLTKSQGNLYGGARVGQPAPSPPAQYNQQLQQQRMHFTPHLTQGRQPLYTADISPAENLQGTQVTWSAPPAMPQVTPRPLTLTQYSFAPTALQEAMHDAAQHQGPPVFAVGVTNNSYILAPPVLSQNGSVPFDARPQHQTYSPGYLPATGGILSTPIESSLRAPTTAEGKVASKQNSVLGDICTRRATNNSIFTTPPCPPTQSTAIFANFSTPTYETQNNKQKI